MGKTRLWRVSHVPGLCLFVGLFVFKEGEITLLGVKSVDLAVVCVWGHWAWVGDGVGTTAKLQGRLIWRLLQS